jgi:hypothetical protein
MKFTNVYFKFWRGFSTWFMEPCTNNLTQSRSGTYTYNAMIHCEESCSISFLKLHLYKYKGMYSTVCFVCYIYLHFPFTSFEFVPERIWVRIDPPHPLVCRKRRLNGAVFRMEKPRSRVTAGVAR